MKPFKKCIYLVYTYIVLRLVVVFLLIPFIHLFWNKKSYAHEGMTTIPDSEGFDVYLGPISRVLRILRSFDAEHFYYIIKSGYNNEKNHAFFPGYPLNLLFFILPFPKKYIEIVQFVLKLAMGSYSSVLIYFFGKWLFCNNFIAIDKDNLNDAKIKKYEKMADIIAFGAAMLFNVNQCLIYSVAMYSEILFIWA